MSYQFYKSGPLVDRNFLNQVYFTRTAFLILLGVAITLLVISGQQSDETKKNNLLIVGMSVFGLALIIMMYNMTALL